MTVARPDGGYLSIANSRVGSQVKYLNNVLEQDHRGIKCLTGPGLGFGSFWTARRTLAGFEAMAMIRKGQVRKIDGRDMRAQAAFIAELFGVAA